MLHGRGTVVQVCKLVWELHREDLEKSGDLFYTWQYDIRWAAQNLRDAGVLVKLDGDRTGVWTLAGDISRSGAEQPSDSAAFVTAWARDEIEVAVESYMRMLRAEKAGLPYVKVQENLLVVQATGRSRGAVEFKYANISAVLDELGLPYVVGYKPRTNVQSGLRTAVVSAVEGWAADTNGQLLGEDL